MSLETKDLIEGVKRRPLLFVCGGLAVALGLLMYFRAGLPGELRGRLQEREKELSRLTNNVKFSAQLDAQVEALRAANARIEAGALRAGELARNQQLFVQLEAESGAKLIELRQLPLPTPAAPVAGKGAVVAAPATTFVTIPFSVTVKGDYPQLMQFLKGLEHGPTLSRIVSAAIAQPTDDAQSVSLSVELLGFRS